MSAGVSPVSPVVAGTQAARTQYDATPVSPAVKKASTLVSADPPSRYDPSMTKPRPVNDGFQSFSLMA